jgi:hypothetical protein
LTVVHLRSLTFDPKQISPCVFSWHWLLNYGGKRIAAQLNAPRQDLFEQLAFLYGSLGAIIIIVVLIGAEFNAETEHQTVRDTTTGRPKPLGARGATMADTVGARQN